MCWYQDLDLAASARSIGVARERATSHLVAVAPDLQGSDVLWDLELMLSEMVTNSLRAGASDIFVATQMHRDHVRITVGDDAAGWPQRRSASADEDSGRGLAILEAVSDAWGIVGDSGHKEVWVLMQVPDEVRTPPDCVL